MGVLGLHGMMVMLRFVISFFPVSHSGTKSKKSMTILIDKPTCGYKDTGGGVKFLHSLEIAGEVIATKTLKIKVQLLLKCTEYLSDDRTL